MLLSKHQEQIEKYAHKISDKKKTLEHEKQSKAKIVPPKPSVSEDNEKIRMLEVKNSLQNGAHGQLGQLTSEFGR